MFDLSLAEETIVFTRKLSDVTVKKLPGKAVFECEINKTNATAQWFKDDKQIKDSKRYSIEVEGTIHRLTIKDVDSVDEADYTIKVRAAKSTAALTVQGKIHTT